MGRKFMNAKDAIAAPLAECYVTIKDKRYFLMQAINIEAKVEKTKTELPIMGKTGKGNRSTGWKGTGKCTIYYNTSVFRELLHEYKETGQDIYFDMQLTNEDETSTVGRQTTILRDCNINGGIIALAQADGEFLQEDIEFTFEDFGFPEKFEMLDGMM